MRNVKSHLAADSAQLLVESGGCASILTAQDPNIDEEQNVYESNC